MKREAHKAAVRAKILGVARRLFLRKGYGQTTIRAIAKLADVRTGSIYHFFGNKEGIFKEIAVEAFHRITGRVEVLVGPNDHLSQLAAELTWHAYVMISDPKATELYLITYNSPQVAEAVLAQHLGRSEQFFLARAPDLTDLEHLARAMIVRSTMQSIALYTQSGQLNELEPLLEECLRLLFRALGFETDEIRTALERVRGLSIKERVDEALGNGGIMGSSTPLSS